MKSVDKSLPSQSYLPLYQDPRLQMICGVSLIAFMGIPSIIPAFPKIVQALSVSPQNVGLLITAFTLPNVLLGPALGIFADRIGRKTILVSSLFLFSFAGMACASASDFPLLLAMRFLQGTGAASLIFLSVTLIGDFYTERERTIAMGYQASVISLGTASYPIMGGVLATWGWNYPFLLSGLGIPIGIWVWRALILAKPEPQKNLSAHAQRALSVILEWPFLKLFASTMTTFMLLSGACVIYLPLLIQLQFGASSITVGLSLSVLFATVTLTASQFSQLAKLCSHTGLIQFSFLLYTIALIIIPLVQELRNLLIPIIIYGVALGIGLPSIQNSLTSLTPPDCRAAVMSFNGAVLGMGQALGPVLLGIAYRFWQLNGIFWVGAAISLGLFLLLRERGKAMD